MTEFRAVYVFDYNQPYVVPAHQFIHLMPGAFEVNNGNARSPTFPEFHTTVVTVAAPKNTDPMSTMKSRTFYGFQGLTMVDAIRQLVAFLPQE